MKKSYVYGIWALLYCICVGLGFVSDPQGAGKALLVATGFIFFLPPFYLAWRAGKENSRKDLLILRLISGGILLFSLCLLVLNLLSVNFSAHTGLVLYVMLVMFSAPMFCIQHWALGLFLWACLLMLTLLKPRPCQR